MIQLNVFGLKKETLMVLKNESFELSIKGKLKSALQMPNIMVLAGSGTSLGDVVNGPRMWDLWEACTTNDMLTIANECFSESGLILDLNLIKTLRYAFLIVKLTYKLEHQ